MTRRTALFVAVFFFGAYALCAQAVLLREAQVILFGSELSWGLVLAFWLAGVAGGARVGGWLSHRAWPAFAGAGVALPLVLVVAIALLRSSRMLLGVGPGEYVGPGEMALITLAATLPVSFWVGLSFPAASALAADMRAPVLTVEARKPAQQARAVGRVYLVESAGSLVGGILFSFVLVERLDSVTLAFAGGAVLAASIAVAAVAAGQQGPVRFLPTAFAVIAIMFIAMGKAGTFNESSMRLRWQSFAGGLDLVESADSRYHNLAVGRLEDQFSLYANGVLAATWEGLLKELLRYKPEALDYVTLDPRLLEVIGPHLAEPDRQALAQVGSGVHFQDIRRFVNRAVATGAPPYDFIYLAAAEPASTLEARLYSEEFFRELYAILSDDGVLAFSLHGAPGYWGPEPAAFVESIVGPLQGVFPETLLTFGYPTRCFVAKRKGVLTDSGPELARRYEAAGVQSPYFDPLWFKGASDLLDPAKRASLAEALARGAGAMANTDDRPSAAVYHMRFWLMAGAASHADATSPARQRPDVLGFLLGLRLEWVLLAAVAATALAAGAGLVRGRAGLVRAAVAWSVGTTGFATMAIEVVLLYTFQSLYGYVYGQVGLVIGVFMFGLVIGSWAMNRRLGADGWHGHAPLRDHDAVTGQAESARRVSVPAASDTADVRGGYGDPPRNGSASTSAPPPGLRSMIWLDVAIALFAGGLVLALSALRGVAADWVVQAATFGLVAVAGVLGGLVFPLAAVIVLQAGKEGWHGHAMLGDHEPVQAHGHATARDHATRPSGCETGRAAASVDAADNAGACLG
ncbi:MAG: hypothetical protein NT049_04425 [Planctomycetota bacterium]|nr:hypothetical protein [Planctomycetota bacterium]